MTTKKKAAVRVIALAVCAVMLIAFGTGCTNDALSRAEEAYQAALKAEEAANKANQAANNAQTSAENALDKAEGAGSVAGSKLTEQEVIAAITNALSSYVKKDYVDSAVKDALASYAKTADVEGLLAAYVKSEDVEAKIAEAIEKIGVTEGAATKAELEAAIATIVKEETIKSWIDAGKADVEGKIAEELKKYQTVEASAAAIKTLTDTVTKLQNDIKATITKAVEDLAAADAALTKKLTDEIARLDKVDAAAKIDLVNVIKDCATNTEGLAEAVKRIEALEGGLTLEQSKELTKLAADFAALTESVDGFKTVVNTSFEALRKADKEMADDIEELTKLYTALAKDITDAKNLINALEIAYKNADSDIIDRIDAIDEKLENIGEVDGLDELKAQLKTVVETDIPALKELIGKVEALENLSNSFIAIDEYNKATNGDDAYAGAIETYLKLEAERENGLFTFFVNNEDYEEDDRVENTAKVKALYYTAVAKVLRALTLSEVTEAWNEFESGVAALKSASIQKALYDRLVAVLGKLGNGGIVLSTEYALIDIVADGGVGEYKLVEGENGFEQVFGENEVTEILRIYAKASQYNDAYFADYKVEGKEFLTVATSLYNRVIALDAARTDAIENVNPLIAKIPDDFKDKYKTFLDILGDKALRYGLCKDANNAVTNNKEGVYDAYTDANDIDYKANVGNFIIGQAKLDAANKYCEEFRNKLVQLGANAQSLANEKYAGSTVDYISLVDDAEYIVNVRAMLEECKTADVEYGFEPAKGFKLVSDIRKAAAKLQEIADYITAIEEFTKDYNEDVAEAINAYVAGDYVYDATYALFDAFEYAIGNLKDTYETELCGHYDEHYDDIVGEALLAEIEATHDRREALDEAALDAYAIVNGGTIILPSAIADTFVDGQDYYVIDNNGYVLLESAFIAKTLAEHGYEVYTDREYTFANGVNYYTADGYTVVYSDVIELRALEEAIEAWVIKHGIDNANRNSIVNIDAFAKALETADELVYKMINSFGDVEAAYNLYVGVADKTDKIYGYVALKAAHAALDKWKTNNNVVGTLVEVEGMEDEYDIANAIDAAWSITNDFLDVSKEALLEKSVAVSTFIEKWVDGYNVTAKDAWVADAMTGADLWIDTYLINGAWTYNGVTLGESYSSVYLTEALYGKIVDAYKAYEAAVAAELAEIAAISDALAAIPTDSLMDFETANFDEVDAAIEAYGLKVDGMDARIVEKYNALVIARNNIASRKGYLNNLAVVAFANLGVLPNAVTLEEYATLSALRKAYDRWILNYAAGATLEDKEYVSDVFEDAYAYGVALKDLENTYAEDANKANAAAMESFVNPYKAILEGKITAGSKADIEAARRAYNDWVGEYGLANVAGSVWYEGYAYDIEYCYELLLDAENILDNMGQYKQNVIEALNAIDASEYPTVKANFEFYVGAEFVNKVNALNSAVALYCEYVLDGGKLVANAGGDYALTNAQVYKYEEVNAYNASIEMLEDVIEKRTETENAFSTGIAAGTYNGSKAADFSEENNTLAQELIEAIIEYAGETLVYSFDDPNTAEVETLDSLFAAVLANEDYAGDGVKTDDDTGNADWDTNTNTNQPI